MQIKQIGNGGAFDYQSVNSAFLIENNDEYLLFDCGYSVYAELRRQDEAGDIDLKKLTSIYISHMDDDHIGSLKTLLYYQYFVNGITTKVYAVQAVFDEIEELFSKTNTKLENGKFVPAEIVEVKRLYSFDRDTIIGLDLMPAKCYHHTVCYGIVVASKKANHLHGIYISGDTKATTTIRNIMNEMDNIYANYLLFHDFSNWDCEGSQVHACKSDTERLYSSEVLANVNWYHNNADFNGDWQTI